MTKKSEVHFEKSSCIIYLQMQFGLNNMLSNAMN